MRWLRCASAALLASGISAAPPGASLADPVFTDVTVQAGVDYVQYQLASPIDIQEPTYMSGGAAAADVDGDGWVDLYVTRLDAPDLLFHNRGDGSFEDATAGSGLDVNLRTNGAGFADLDNDGDLDLYVTGMGGTRHYLFVNDGSGHFTEQAVARGAAVTTAAPLHGYGPAFGDYDRDGWLDLYVGEWAFVHAGGRAAAARLLRNRGSTQPGHFEDVTAAAGLTLDGVVGREHGYFAFAPRFVDMDRDGWQDLVIASDFGESRLFWNDGDGTFTDGTAAAGVGGDENGMGNAVGDYDGDGWLDWFVTSIYDPDQTCETRPCNWGYTGNRLYRNRGDRTFEDATDSASVRDGYWGWGAAFFDFDNDGDLDLGMTNGQDFPFVPPALQAFGRFVDDPLRLWRNEGSGAMTEISAPAGLTDTGSGKGYLTFDYDRDGDLDVFVANATGHPVLYRNDGGNAQDWLRVEVRGRRGTNRDGIGARVEVIAASGAPVQAREIDGGSNFLGHSERIAHFGLGELELPWVREVRVTWPASGARRVLRWVRKNSTLVVVESPPRTRVLPDLRRLRR